LDLQTQLGSVLIGLVFYRLVRGEIKQAAPYAEQILRLGDAQNNQMWKCLGAIFSGTVSYWLGNFVDARSCFDEALPLWDSSYRAVSPSPDDSRVVGLIHLARTLVCLGLLDQARLRRDEALAEARRLSPYNVVFALGQNWLGVDSALGGEKSARTVLQMAQEVLTISSEQGFPLWVGVGTAMRGWCLSALGQAAEGIPYLRQGIADLQATGCKVSVPANRVLLAEACGRAGQLDEGLSELTDAIKQVEATHECWALAEIFRVRGTLLLSANRQAAAENSFDEALTIARRQRAKFWELRAALDLARLWRDQGKREEARELLAPVYGWFTEGFDTRDLKEAKALLEELAA
jgi:tetratricopeptide (TPR) repeat protein